MHPLAIDVAIDPLLQLTEQAGSQGVVHAFQPHCRLPVTQPDAVVLRRVLALA